MNVLDELDKFTELRRSEENIVCPYCGKINYEPLNPHGCDMDELITYHGETGPIEFECMFCDKLFLVEEFVARTYAVTEMEDNEPYDEEKDYEIDV